MTGVEANNYAFDTSAQIGSADIDRKVLTATANVADKTYDGSTTASLSNLALIGIVGGDAGKVNASGTTGTFVDKNAGQNKAVSGSGVALTGVEANNYAFDTAARIGTADIGRKLLNATVDIADKLFDGANTATIRAVALDGVIAGDGVGATGKALFDTPQVGQGKTVSVINLLLHGDDAANYQLADQLQVGTANIEPSFHTPVGLINDAPGANGTEVAINRPGDWVAVEVHSPAQSIPSTALFSDTPDLTNVAANFVGVNELVLQDAVLNGNGRMSLALADGVSEPAVQKSLALYRTRAGEPLSGEGQYSATDLGNSLTLELIDGGSHQTPVLQGSGGGSVEGSVAMASGQRLNLQVNLLSGGVLMVKVPPAASDIATDELAAYGLVVAKKRLGISVRNIEAVIIEHSLRQARIADKSPEVVSR